jgi:kynurenine formamidase
MNNWGRWGAGDERGALNLLTAGRVRVALGCAARGEVVFLSQPVSFRTAIPDGRTPVSLVMTRDGGDYAADAQILGRSRVAEDVVTLETHTGTHVDAFAHLWYDEQLYNGHPQAAVRSRGARRCGVEKLGPIVGRGVLLDAAATLGVDAMAAGQKVDAEILERCCANGGIAVGPGDVALIRTGWLGAGTDTRAYFAGEPGIDVSGARWLAEHDVAAVGADNYAVEALEQGTEGGFPVHELLLRDLGTPLIEGLVLDQLAALGARSFLFVGAPLPLVGATAGPLSAVAVL